jgi:hypothetical protein
MLRLLWLALSLVTGFLQSSAIAADPREDLYRQALHILGGNASVIHKWNGPVRLMVVGDPALHSAARKTLTEVASITALEVQFPDAGLGSAAEYLALLHNSPPNSLGSNCSPDPMAGRCFNLVVVFASSAQMEQIAGAIPLPRHFQLGLQRAGATPCYFAPYIRARHEIYKAVIYIRDDLSPAMQRTCLAEEIYQAMGMFEDYTDSRYFSFNNRVEAKQITAHDKALLRALYDPRVRLGTPANTVVRLFLDHHLP